MSGMRTVSFFGPKVGGIEGGRTEADNGRVAGGGFGEGQKLVDEISPGADCGEEGTGALPVSRSFTLGSGGFVGGRTGNWIRTVSFFGLSGSAISVKEFDQKSPTCHYPILQRRKM